MRIELNVPDYSPQQGVRLDWDDGFTIDVQTFHNEVVIRANGAGLTSLARHLLELAQPNVLPGTHFHLDSSASLEDGSFALIVERYSFRRVGGAKSEW